MKLDNKRLVKICVISGSALLILFIFFRLAVKSSAGGISDMPSVGQLDYSPKKVKEESKIQEFEDQKKENEKKAMGDDKSQIPVPDFNTLISNNENTTSSKSASTHTSPEVINTYPHSNTSQQHFSGYSSARNPSRTNYSPSSDRKTNPSSRLNYHSDYFKNDPPAVQSSQNTSDAEQNQIASGNPFGTITSDGAQNQNKTASRTNYYSAEIYGDQNIQDGGEVRIRNTVALQYMNLSIPRNSILYGQANFRGNRVIITVTRAKTPSGEFSVSFSVKDNDKIDGLYYKAPIDQTMDNTKNNVNAPAIPVTGALGGVINSVTQTVVRSGKDLMQRTASLNLEEGYKIYIVQK